MKFLTYRHNGKTAAGALHENTIIDLGHFLSSYLDKQLEFHDLRDLVEKNGTTLIKEFDKKLLPDKSFRRPLASISAPILRPPKIICLGLNYRDHAEEQKQPLPELPLLFTKASNVVIGDGEAIRLPKQSQQVDYEVELAVIIGKQAHNVDRKDAMNYVFGYTIMNDVSARDIQFSDKQWFRGKSFATFAPLGPIVVTQDEVDADNLEISLKLNGKMMQKSNTKNLIFKIPFLIEFISSCFPLEAGDVISTGTPGGVGVFQNPKVFLKPGDTIEASIEGIGTLRNSVTC